ncbi:uncharacterized protein LOC122500411 [Leptopilina heterotoma]|uniref:uncharacterized protein LOC122500411 n=1 Tax=Leptopilina heterotoma TaxID=63436 RepID=UPI001CA920C6|nr:uncharacterized protein LOC122500411 [Leptopilina heterotoma]XP_043465266.1 uncharacterized protein LOC122500411 [Leptopilina heterotoma]XP_043465267.1 uncharacterized protein LOC122500411 [Leptopilina heterotoma]
MLENRKKLDDLLSDWSDSDSNESSDLSSEQNKGVELNSELNNSLDENRRKETPRVLSPFQQQLVPSLSEDNEGCSLRQQENPKLQNKRPKLTTKRMLDFSEKVVEQENDYSKMERNGTSDTVLLDADEDTIRLPSPPES